MAAACAALAAVAAIDLIDSDPSGPGVVDRAVAAVSQQDAVYHVLERVRIPAEFVTVGGPPTLYFESWHTTDGSMHQKEFAAKDGRKGRLFIEIAGRRRPGLDRGPGLRYDPAANIIYRSGFGSVPSEAPTIDPYGDPGASLRALEAQGRLRLRGTTTVRGRPAYRLGSETARSGRERERVEYIVDRETYLPLAQRRWWQVKPGPKYRFDSRYLVYERLPLNARTRRLLALDPPRGARCAKGAGQVRADRPLGYPNPCRPSGRAGPARVP